MKSPASTTNAMCTSCSALKAGTFATDPAVLWKLSASSSSNQNGLFHLKQHQTATPLGTNCSDTRAKIHKTATQSGWWDSEPQPPLEQNVDTIRSFTRLRQPHILARAAQALDKAHSIEFASSMLKAIWGPRAKSQTLNKN